MTLWICTACGAEHPDTATPPAGCPICLDERQYVPPGGQTWTSAAELKPHSTFRISVFESDLSVIVVEPDVGIGQRTLLVRTSAGNLLWEPSGYVDETMIAAVRELGGIAGIAVSHPHLAGASVSWSQAFGGVPIHWNAHDERWIMRRDPAHTLWHGSLAPLPGIRLVQTGGHFPGSAVLHWPAGADGRGVLFVGDTMMVGPGQRTVSFMRSYPNQLPLPARLVNGIVGALEPLAYDRVYGLRREILSGAKEIVADSAQRYLGWLRDEIRDPDEQLHS